jgi:hypothetical protein
MVGGPLVQVTAADADVGDFEQDVFFTDDGSGDLADFDGALFGGEVYDGGVMHESMEYRVWSIGGVLSGRL